MVSFVYEENVSVEEFIMKKMMARYVAVVAGRVCEEYSLLVFLQLFLVVSDFVGVTFEVNKIVDVVDNRLLSQISQIKGNPTDGRTGGASKNRTKCIDTVL